MNANPGDIVVAVHGGLCLVGRHAPLDARPEMVGKTFRVTSVTTWWDGRPNYTFRDYPGDYCGGCFRKLNDEPDDIAVIRMICAKQGEQA